MTQARRSAIRPSRMTKTSAIDMRLAGVAGGLAGQLGHHHVVLLDHAHDREPRRPREPRPFDGRVVGRLTREVEGAEDGPLDVVGQAGQDLGVVALPEPVEIALHRDRVP
jgi:hypothetical protein